MITLKEILQIPTCSSNEELLVSFIENFCIKNNYSYKKDHKNNLYITKGTAKYFPCVVAHTDTVHDDQIELISNDLNLQLKEKIFNEEKRLYAYNPLTNKPTGIGGDDKCGVYICLRLLESLENIKVAFFVEEEIGMLGSKECDLDFFKDVGYAVQFDAPTDNWFSEYCSGEQLWNESFFEEAKDVLKEYSIDNISYDPFTDIVQLRRKFDFCCSVLPTGYYNQHSINEYVVPEHTEKCVNFGKKFIEKLGLKKFTFDKYIHESFNNRPRS
jgi:tripeptide aminopeptidase